MSTSAGEAAVGCPDVVLGTARTGEKATEACSAFPGDAIGYACELADPSSVRNCVAAVIADGHRLDAIICNAGIMMLPKLEKLAWVMADPATLSNAGRARVRTVRISFRLFDARGHAIGRATAEAHDLAPGQVWKFHAPARGNVSRARLLQVEAR